MQLVNVHGDSVIDVSVKVYHPHSQSFLCWLKLFHGVVELLELVCTFIHMGMLATSIFVILVRLGLDIAALVPMVPPSLNFVRSSGVELKD